MAIKPKVPLEQCAKAVESAFEQRVCELFKELCLALEHAHNPIAEQVSHTRFDTGLDIAQSACASVMARIEEQARAEDGNEMPAPEKAASEKADSEKADSEKAA